MKRKRKAEEERKRKRPKNCNEGLSEMDKENFFNAATAFVTFGNEKVTAGPVRQDGFKSFPLLAIY